MTVSASPGKRHSYVGLPAGWEHVSASGPGPFITREDVRAPDGTLVRWQSRGHRKQRSSVWIGVLFAIGSTCFAVAAIASQWASTSRPAIGVTFFVGSIFFTAAAYLQYAEAANVPHSYSSAGRRRWRPASWEPRRIDWLATSIQFAGTILFNVSTFEGMKRGLDAQESNLRVWTPDVFGSICFLVASELAFAETCHRWVCARGRSLPWRIAALNLLGSIAFGVAAVATLVEPSDDEPVSAAVGNAGTAVGAICFLAGALLLIVEARRTSAQTIQPTGRGNHDGPSARHDPGGTVERRG
jgi:YrhK-like protein